MNPKPQWKNSNGLRYGYILLPIEKSRMIKRIKIKILTEFVIRKGSFILSFFGNGIRWAIS